MFGLHETGLISIDLLNKEFKPGFRIDLSKMNFFKAFLLGFVFSLGWSPCIGPMLANAMLLAATTESGYLHIVFGFDQIRNYMAHVAAAAGPGFSEPPAADGGRTGADPLEDLRGAVPSAAIKGRRPAHP